MEIIVQTRSVYGCNKVYPMCPTAKKLATLAGHITLTEHDLACIRNLGYKVTDLAVVGLARACQGSVN